MTADDNLFDEHNVVAGMLLEESDRGCALFGAQMIDDKLKELFECLFISESPIRKVSKGLLSGYGPLATFSAKLDFAYAAGIINNDHYRTANLIRNIRNDMAHERGPISFSHQKVHQKFRALVADGKPAEEDGDDLVEFATSSGDTKKIPRRTLQNRIAFALAVSHLCGAIEFQRRLWNASSCKSIWHFIVSRTPPSTIKSIPME